jgi:hypothetical protein
MSIQRFNLDKFKLEVGNNFDEHNLENILFDLYDDEKYYIITPKSINIKDIKESLISTRTHISGDKKFLFEYSHENRELYIYTFTSLGTFEKYLYLTVVNVDINGLNNYDGVENIKIFNNIIYILGFKELKIINIVDLTLTAIKCQNVKDYYIYKGIVCVSRTIGVSIFNIDGTQYHIPININYMGEIYKDGFLYVCSSDRKIYIINIEDNTFEVLENVNNVYNMCLTKYGKVSISSNKYNLNLPSGKTITLRDIKLSPVDASFHFNPKRNIEMSKQAFSNEIRTNKIGDVLICKVFFITYIPTGRYSSFIDSKSKTNVIILLIDLKSETIIDQIDMGRNHPEDFGFLESNVAEIIDPITIDYEKLKV